MPRYDYTMAGYGRWRAQEEESSGRVEFAQRWRNWSWQQWNGQSSLNPDPNDNKYCVSSKRYPHHWSVP